MNSTEKARARIEHWLKHNHSHLESYVAFADELEQNGNMECADRIREMAVLTAKSNDYLKMALESLS